MGLVYLSESPNKRLKSHLFAKPGFGSIYPTFLSGIFPKQKSYRSWFIPEIKQALASESNEMTPRYFSCYFNTTWEGIGLSRTSWIWTFSLFFLSCYIIKWRVAIQAQRRTILDRIPYITVKNQIGGPFDTKQLLVWGNI